jgi:hypothetical protein
MDSSEVLICLQAQVEELKSKNQHYLAYLVSQAMHLIRKQGEELRLLRGDTDRRSMKRDLQRRELPEGTRLQILSLTN